MTKADYDELVRLLDEAIADIELLAGDTNSAIKCGMCRYNPNDMGCELDGSQFDDDGECHFEWRSAEYERAREVNHE